MDEVANRFARQTDLVPAAKLVDLAVTVIGVGAIGRQVALQLAALGVRILTLVDFDSVESTNITTQGYLEADLGLAKVTALTRALHQIDSTIRIHPVEDHFRPAINLGEAVFCCVDSIAARGAIWRSSANRCRFWCDGRMLGEVMRILSAADRRGRDHFSSTLFESIEAVPGACTARGTIYTAAIAAGLMVHQFGRWLRGQPVDPDLTLNLLASELVAHGSSNWNAESCASG
jgi:sulfur carrier protein ThiS adenylyltransferase